MLKIVIQIYIFLIFVSNSNTTNNDCCNVMTLNGVSYYCICGGDVSFIDNICYCGSDSSAPPCRKKSCYPPQTTGVIPITTGRQYSVTTGNVLTTGNNGETTSISTNHPNQSSSNNYVIYIFFLGMVLIFSSVFIFACIYFRKRQNVIVNNNKDKDEKKSLL